MIRGRDLAGAWHEDRSPQGLAVGGAPDPLTGRAAKVSAKHSPDIELLW
jgi:hypothetical protein